MAAHPSSASVNAVVAILGKDAAIAILLDLEKRLQLIQTVGPGKDRIRFTLDPLAEYLAGLYLLEKYHSNSESWRGFLAQADKMPGAPARQ
ncbi:MAG: hypothetical protein ACRERU_00560 [Methylococcales bacterium]